MSASKSNLKNEKNVITESGTSFTTGQSWGALRKSWKGYRIAKAQEDKEKMLEYANKIRKLQKELGQNVASFPNLGLE